jgi:hypothetical protein
MKSIYYIIFCGGVFFGCLEKTDKVKSDSIYSYESMRKLYPSYTDSVSVDGKKTYLVNKNNGVDHEVLGFDSNGVYNLYVHYKKESDVSYIATYDNDLNLINEEGNIYHMVINRCYDSTDNVVFYANPITPPFFNTKMEVFTMDDIKSKFVISHRPKEVKDDTVILYKDLEFEQNKEYKILFKIEKSDYCHADSINLKVERCLDNIPNETLNP